MQKMEDRKWEDMSTDCLANIFGRLDIESRLLCIPVVCKPWYRVVHENPLCWQELDLRAVDSELKRSSLMKIVANHSQRCAISHALIKFFTTHDLIRLSKASPALKILELSAYFELACLDDFVPSFEGKWKNLKFISIDDTDYIVELIELVCVHLTSFTGLRIGCGNIHGNAASTIASLLPKLKYLSINHTKLEKKNLLIILQGCRELVFLDVRNCIGFDEDDEEILKLSSTIKSFHCDGSKVRDYAHDYDDYDYYHCDDFDLDCPYDNCDGIEWA